MPVLHMCRFPWAPDFLLKRLVLSGFKDGPHEPLIADSIDFVVARMDQKLSRSELASRLALNTQLAAASPVQLPDSSITIMDCNDFASVPGKSLLPCLPEHEHAEEMLLPACAS